MSIPFVSDGEVTIPYRTYVDMVKNTTKNFSVESIALEMMKLLVGKMDAPLLSINKEVDIVSVAFAIAEKFVSHLEGIRQREYEQQQKQREEILKQMHESVFRKTFSEVLIQAPDDYKIEQRKDSDPDDVPHYTR